MPRIIHLDDDRVLFRRVKGRIIPIKVSARQRLKRGAKASVGPAILGGAISEIGLGVWRGKDKKMPVLKRFSSGFSVKRFGLITVGTVAFSSLYNTFFGAGHKNVIKDVSKKRQTKILLASKPAFDVPHPFGHHSFLVVTNQKGSSIYGGQMRGPSKRGKVWSRLSFKKNYRTDRLKKATDIYDLTPGSEKEARKAAKFINAEAERLSRQLKTTDLKYRTVPIKRGTYNSNSIPATLITRAGLKKPRGMVTNLPGFNRTIPRPVGRIRNASKK